MEKTTMADFAAVRGKISQWISYLYFLRFPLLAWVMLPLLCLADARSGASTITRGILTLSSFWQSFHAAFFVTALMMAVLICARNIVKNGQERFDSEPPHSLWRALTSANERTIWIVLACAHIPSVIALWYLAATSIGEQEPYLGKYAWALWLGYVCGLVFAAIFWLLVSLFYWWTYPHHAEQPPTALIFPAKWEWAKKAQDERQPQIARWVNGLGARLTVLTHAGFANSSEGLLYELHTLTTIAAGAFFLLYVYLYPLVAPVVVNNGYVEIGVAVAVFVAFCFGVRNVPAKKDGATEGASFADGETVAGQGEDEGISPVGRFFRAALLVLLVIFISVVLLDNLVWHKVMMATAFPTIASVLVIAIFGLWMISGAGFLLDRYRVPVLTLTVAFVFVSKWWIPVDQDHYYSATATTRLTDAEMVSPEQAIEDRVPQGHEDEPYVIVTATGGGIQAAEWTAQMLTAMETSFGSDDELKKAKYTLHDHLLLASGVSGGSVGMLPFLLEYTAPTDKGFPDVGNKTKYALFENRMIDPPGCTSLEAVAWGLEYYDLQRLLLTVRIPWLQSTAQGEAPDRTWALTQSFGRNLDGKNQLCETSKWNDVDPEPTAEQESKPGVHWRPRFSLKDASLFLRRNRMPAFSLNTTVAETGGRFLLSNYEVPVSGPGCSDGPKRCPYAGGDVAAVQAGSDFLPSESFLQAYARESQCDQGKLEKTCYADLALTTAARLSATFPVVSSATRIPREYTKDTPSKTASHFIDGGYYDNDGTATATEFLYSAMRERQQAKGDATKPQHHKLKVLLVEIRDGDDLNPLENADDWGHQTGGTVEKGDSAPTTWSTMQQVLAPLVGMWEAGHESVTRRNRRELCGMETAFKGDLEIHHVVFGIPQEPKDGGGYKASPLNWKLTGSQRKYIEKWVTDDSTKRSMVNAREWVVKEVLAAKAGQPAKTSVDAPVTDDDPTCKVWDQTYMRQ